MVSVWSYPWGEGEGGEGRTSPGQVGRLRVPAPHIWAVQSQQLTAAAGPPRPRGSCCSHQAKCSPGEPRGHRQG